MSFPVRPILHRLEATESPRQLASLTDDLLEEILIRVASPADLARASTVCISFHRLITDPIFLRRYRSLHPPLFLGLINVNGGDASFEPAEAPLPGAPAGRAIARAADFSFSYVPRGRWGSGWYPSDVYDGRVLLECCCPDSDREGVLLPDVAVCDPLSRRYLLLPPIPDPDVQSYKQKLERYDVLFAPCVDEDDETSFRVILDMHCTEELVVVVFSSSSGSWSFAASTSWDTLRLSRPTGLSPKLRWRSYAYNCLYWAVYETNKLIKLNMNTKKFSTVDLPPEHEKRIIIIVEEGDGILGMLSDHIYDETLPAHYYTSVQKDGKKIANEWQLKKIVPIPTDICYIYSVCEVERYIFLEDQYTSRCFTLDFKTMKFEMVGTTKCKDAIPYLGYPPSMSPRRI